MRPRTLLRGGLTLAALLLCETSRGGDAVDGYVADEMRQQRIPGLSLALVEDGRVVKAQGYGLANVELQAPATAETVYQSGSVGKQFTAALVLLLVEEGRIHLDDPISRYLAGAPRRWKHISVRQLLTHTSGLGDYTDAVDLRRDYTEPELLKLAASQPLAFSPGAGWSYSNTGYMLLGQIVRQATGRFYGDLLAERIFRPLGMGARIISEADIVPGRAAGYRLVDGALKNQEWVAPSINTTADGALYLTALDLARWDAALYGETLLKRASLEEMWTPARLRDGRLAESGEGGAHYGFGWSLGTQRGHRKIEHGGAWQGFKCHIARYVDDGLTVIVLANLAGADTGRIAHAVAGLVKAELGP